MATNLKRKIIYTDSEREKIKGKIYMSNEDETHDTSK